MRLPFLLLMLSIAFTGRPALALDYVHDVLPILETYCIGCHTADEAQGGLVMESHAALMAGGDSGLAVTAGVASSSRMFLMAAGKLEPVMPPDDMDGPTPDELEILASWIDAGAVGPEGDMPIKRTLRTPQIATSQTVTLPITAMARTTDERLTAIARFGSIKIQNNDGVTVSQLGEDLGKINSLVFNRAGDRLLAATGLTGAYGQAVLFDVPGGNVIDEFLGHRDVLYAAEFSPDGNLIATAGYDRQILIWNVQNGEVVTQMDGHNGAIFDLAFSPDGKQLVSACADETAKIWDVTTGERLDTLSQPEGEVYTVEFTRDGRFVLAGSADNRLRVWRFVSKEKPRINPIVQTRFVDESPVVQMKTTHDGNGLVIVSESGNLKLLRTDDWSVVTALAPVDDIVTDLIVSRDAKSLSVSLMNGQIVERTLPPITTDRVPKPTSNLTPVYLDVGPLTELVESKVAGASGVADVPRGASIQGTIQTAGERDGYRFMAKRGEVWCIEGDKTTGNLDPKIVIEHGDTENGNDANGNGTPVLRARLQAVRDTYFTFRGKDSKQVGDFRLFNWQEIGLNQYLYSNGEVTRTYMHPRGPDSGFNVYPNEGNRFTYFGTTHTTHALGEPAYVVRELGPDEPREANGLPVFEIYYENDDDPSRAAGNSSRLLFTAPDDAEYVVRVGDTRGQAAPDFGYELRIRPAKPSFEASYGAFKSEIRPGTGREIPVIVKRSDGFEGPVEFSISVLPEGWRSTFPVTVESHQRRAEGMVWVPEGTPGSDEKWELRLTATALINGVVVERDGGRLKDFKIGKPSQVIAMIQPIDRDLPANEDWTLDVEVGQTVSARVVLKRADGFDGEVRFGKETAGRNTSHGVYVDNIGLVGLLVLPNQNEREFFLTADEVVTPGERTFFLKAETDGGLTTHPITVNVK